MNTFDTYTYDALGNVLSDTNQEGEWVYTYDADSQLIHAVFTPNNSDPDGLTAQDIQYVYDPAGNWISETVNGVVTTYAVNNVNEYASSTTNGITTSYRYDAAGNRIQEVSAQGTTNYTYDEENRLTGIAGPGGTWNYQYNALGNLVATTHNGQSTNYLVDPAGLGNVVGEYGSSSLIAHYTYGLGLVSRTDATGSAAYYDFNALGSTVGLTGSGGKYLNRYSYLPFGESRMKTEVIPNPFAYIGEWGVMGEGDGLDFMRARFYTPAEGRFLSTDPIGQAGGFNVYTYAENQPTNYIDDTGTGVGGVGKNRKVPKVTPPKTNEQNKDSTSASRITIRKRRGTRARDKAIKASKRKKKKTRARARVRILPKLRKRLCPGSSAVRSLLGPWSSSSPLLNGFPWRPLCCWYQGTPWRPPPLIPTTSSVPPASVTRTTFPSTRSCPTRSTSRTSPLQASRRSR